MFSKILAFIIFLVAISLTSMVTYTYLVDNSVANIWKYTKYVYTNKKLPKEIAL